MTISTVRSFPHYFRHLLFISTDGVTAVVMVAPFVVNGDVICDGRFASSYLYWQMVISHVIEYRCHASCHLILCSRHDETRRRLNPDSPRKKNIFLFKHLQWETVSHACANACKICGQWFTTLLETNKNNATLEKWIFRIDYFAWLIDSFSLCAKYDIRPTHQYSPFQCYTCISCITSLMLTRLYILGLVCVSLFNSISTFVDYLMPKPSF